MQQLHRGAKASKFIVATTLAWAACAGTAHAIPISGQGTWETTLQSRDINSDGTVDAYYDTALNITWLADSNLPKTQGVSEGMGAGVLSVTGAQYFVDNLDVYGVGGWRLSHVNNEVPAGCTPSSSNRCNFQPSAADSELAHLYYVTLGNAYGAITNTGNFLNLDSFNGYHLTDTTYTNPSGTSFYQLLNFGKGQKLFVREDYGMAAWAVRDGDVALASPAPEPETYAMMLLGLAGVGAWAKRQKRKA
jgi:hypothetical protein